MSYHHDQTIPSALLQITESLDRQFGAFFSRPREYAQIKSALRERGEVYDLTHLYDPDDELNF